MATTPHDPEFTLDISEQVARIDQMHANIAQAQASINQMIANTAKLQLDSRKVVQGTRLAPWSIAATGLGAGAALFAAGAAFAKLLLG